MVDRCVCCGEIIPEGRMVCPNCEIKGVTPLTKHDASEQAYKNGYSAGYEAGRRSVGRKRGRWISLTECANAGVYCSVCNKKVYKEDYAWCNRKNKLRSNYCPNCGADMRGEEDGR